MANKIYINKKMFLTITIITFIVLSSTIFLFFNDISESNISGDAKRSWFSGKVQQEICNDKKDNDGDGFIDCRDLDCDGVNNCDYSVSYCRSIEPYDSCFDDCPYTSFAWCADYCHPRPCYDACLCGFGLEAEVCESYCGAQ